MRGEEGGRDDGRASLRSACDPRDCAVDGRIDQQIREHAENSYTMMWSVDSDDWRRPPVQRIVDDVMRRLHPGAVVLRHEGGGDRTNTVAAVDRLVPRIRAAGHAIRTVC